MGGGGQPTSRALSRKKEPAAGKTTKIPPRAALENSINQSRPSAGAVEERKSSCCDCSSPSTNRTH